MWQGNLLLIDQNCLSIPNNPASVTNGGILINGALNFNGFGLTNASTGAFSSNLTIGGTLGVTGISTLTGGIGSSLTIGTSLANTITLAGKATGTDPTITVAGDATRSLNIVPAAASSSVISGLGISPAGGFPIFMGNLTTGVAGIWFGFTSATATNSNESISASNSALNLASTGTINFNLSGAQYAQFSSGVFSVDSINIVQGGAATALTLKGNAAATGGIAINLDNQTAQTSGTIVSFNTGGTPKATVTWNGGINSGPGIFSATNSSTGITLSSNAAAAGTSLIVLGATDPGGTGLIAEFQSVALTNQFAISGRGHLIPQSTPPVPPTAGSFAAGFFTTGAVSGITLTGSDACMLLKFTTGTSCTQITEQTSLIGTITLSQAYSSTSWAGLAAFASEPTNVSLSYGVNDTAPLIVVPTAAGTFALYAAIPFTPKLSTAYAITIFTMGAGATY
jgi:hypothetical protein